MKSGCRSCALAAASSSALGISRRKITHTSTSIWAMPVRSSAPIALRYSVSIRAWAHTKLIRQIVLTVTWTELKSSNAASLVMLPAANQRHALSSRSLGAVHDGHERSEFGRMQASRRRSMPMPRRPSRSSALPARRSRTHLRSTASSFALPTLAASRAARPASPFKPNSARRSRLSDRLLLPLRVRLRRLGGRIVESLNRAGSRPSLDYFLAGTCCCAGVVLVIASRCHRYTCRILRRR